MLSDLLEKSNISKEGTWCLFVIGHYSGILSNPKKIPLFIEKLKSRNLNADWAVCAFGKEGELYEVDNYGECNVPWNSEILDSSR